MEDATAAIRYVHAAALGVYWAVNVTDRSYHVTDRSGHVTDRSCHVTVKRS